MKAIDISNYDSLYDYLDDIFKNIESPTREMIQEARRAYWRAYNAALKRRQRQEFKIVQLKFSKEEQKEHKAFFEKTKYVNRKLRAIILNYLEGIEPQETSFNAPLIEQQVFLISEYIQEWREEQEVDNDKLQQLESCILAIEKALGDDH